MRMSRVSDDEVPMESTVEDPPAGLDEAKRGHLALTGLASVVAVRLHQLRIADARKSVRPKWAPVCRIWMSISSSAAAIPGLPMPDPP